MIKYSKTYDFENNNGDFLIFDVNFGVKTKK